MPTTRIRKLPLILATLALCLPAEPPSAAGQPAPEWAEDHLAAWYSSYNGGDAAGMGKLYAPDAVLVQPDGPPLDGRAAIEKGFADQFASYEYECVGSNDGWHELGALAVVWGHDDCSQVVKADGATSTYESHWMAAFRNFDGVWLIVYETFALVGSESD